MGDAIRAGKRESASVLRATAQQNRLSPDETLAWMRCLNDIRLLIGTRLDVQEDTDFEAMVDDPLLEQAAIVYVSLSELVGMLSLAAASDLADRRADLMDLQHVRGGAARGRDAAMTTASPGSARPCAMEPVVHQRDHLVRVGGRRRGERRRRPSSTVFARRTRVAG